MMALRHGSPRMTYFVSTWCPPENPYWCFRKHGSLTAWEECRTPPHSRLKNPPRAPKRMGFIWDRRFLSGPFPTRKKEELGEPFSCLDKDAAGIRTARQPCPCSKPASSQLPGELDGTLHKTTLPKQQATTPDIVYLAEFAKFPKYSTFPLMPSVQVLCGLFPKSLLSLIC